MFVSNWQNNSHNTTPSEKISAWQSQNPPSNCSGGEYKGVPTPAVLSELA